MVEGEQNEWHRTKELALLDGIHGWVRMYADRENNGYRSYPAPVGRYGDPNWPIITSQRKYSEWAFAIKAC